MDDRLSVWLDGLDLMDSREKVGAARWVMDWVEESEVGGGGSWVIGWRSWKGGSGRKAREAYCAQWLA